MSGFTSNSSITYNPVTRKHIVNFAGKNIETTVTNKASIADTWVHEMLSIHGARPIVAGLDVEWRPNYRPWESNKPATLQLCINEKCLIIQLFYIDSFPQSLKDFLMNPKITFVGVEVDDAIMKIRNEYGLMCNKRADIRKMAKSSYPGRFLKPGLEDLSCEVVGVRMNKPRNVTMSNWENRFLAKTQIEYGCIDAYASYSVGYKIGMDQLRSRVESWRGR